ncbi:hypothetical protein [Roseateles saccharophilus]|uniref:Uncharacterized protein (TIGR02285 family) n=1 Tax=Roseateles saccharophilus TaxID=304 RepID=A0A4R3VJW9_ROSSA|nr:hypothetical protein [Roseateles saccharophilus]MDG0831343.1 hypothetical protein [Roseateles saccharophilus]TCV04473.1 uncharacterized protein (TIGR02285 family) [Roseateles saccharophilus]
MRQRLCGLAALLLAGSAQAAGPVVDSIVWLNGDTLAVRVGDGVVRPSDMISSWLQAHMPGVELRPTLANAERSWTLVRQGEKACIANAVRLPERERLAYFSAVWLMPPPQLIVRRERLDALPLDVRGAVNLQTLLADASLRGAIAQGRSYGPALDALLAPGGVGLLRVTGADFGSNLVSMVLQDRVDYTVEYPNILVALGSQREGELPLAALPVKGAADPVPSGVACPRTPWGHAAIRLIDQALGTPAGAAMLREALRISLPADTQRAYRDAFDAYFQRRAKPTPGL